MQTMQMRARFISSFFTRYWLVLLTALMLSVPVQAKGPVPGNLPEVNLDQLPREAQQTMALIRQGGPFPYEKDGAVFGNYEGVLPKQKRGYYREYTVKTPRARNRGAVLSFACGSMGCPRCRTRRARRRRPAHSCRHRQNSRTWIPGIHPPLGCPRGGRIPA